MSDEFLPRVFRAHDGSVAVELPHDQPVSALRDGQGFHVASIGPVWADKMSGADLTTLAMLANPYPVRWIELTP